MTTIVLVRKNNEVVVAGDGQVSMGNTVVKSTASKVRKIEKRDVVAGFAGSTADALTLFERLEAKIEKQSEPISEIKQAKEQIAISEKKTKDISSASPKARKFARELGVNINQVVGSEKDGRVIEDDIKKFVSSKTANNYQTKEIKPIKIKNEYEHADFGKVEIKDTPRVKKLASTYLTNSWTTIPHVTNHDEADITEMESFRTSLKDVYTGEKIKITPLAFIIKALVASLKKFPSFNSSIDEIESGKMTLKKYYHIGIAVDTPNGLMVPKIRDANNKKISLIGKELKQVSELCRNLKIDKKELFGGSMTITSLGGIGGSFFTPIINYPEVAILGVGRSEKKQVFLNGKFQIRTMLPISLSYDHRIIDGAEAARFNNDLKENLGNNFAYKLAV